MMLERGKVIVVASNRSRCALKKDENMSAAEIKISSVARR